MAVTFKSKCEIIDKLREQISSKDSTAIHTLLFIFERQSEDEQKHESVRWRNGIGFKIQDAKTGCNLAKWFKSKGFFTPKQIALVKSMVRKYAGQVVEAMICSGEIRQINRGEWVWG